jgi:hypothetical protein
MTRIPEALGTVLGVLIVLAVIVRWGGRAE